MIPCCPEERVRSGRYVGRPREARDLTRACEELARRARACEELARRARELARRARAKAGSNLSQPNFLQLTLILTTNTQLGPNLVIKPME